MMTEKESYEEKFLTLLEGLYANTPSDDPLLKSKSKAWDRFNALELPNRKTESYKYIKLKNLFDKEYSLSQTISINKDQILPHLYPECFQSHLVFVNGQFCLDLSDVTAINGNVVIAPLSKAIRTYGSFLTNSWGKALKEEKDPFATVNMAMQREGLFIYVPPKTIVDAPIQIINILSLESGNKLLTPNTQVFVGKSSTVKIYASTKSLCGNEYMINQRTDFSVDEDAHATYVHTALNEGCTSWHFDAVRATLKRNSIFKSINVNDGNLTYRNDYHIALTQENCEAELDGLWMLSEKNESHAHILIDHQAPHCRSRQLFKGVLRDLSRSSFEGKILVQQAAQQTDAFQLNKNLLLDEYCHCDSKPNLEIFADDVKASHGSTVGSIDDEQLFYLNSRGLSNDLAKNILVYGFCKEVVDRIELPSLYENLKVRAQNYMTP